MKNKSHVQEHYIRTLCFEILLVSCLGKVIYAHNEPVRKNPIANIQMQRIYCPSRKSTRTCLLNWVYFCTYDAYVHRVFRNFVFPVAAGKWMWSSTSAIAFWRKVFIFICFCIYTYWKFYAFFWINVSIFNIISSERTNLFSFLNTRWHGEGGSFVSPHSKTSLIIYILALQILKSVN